MPVADGGGHERHPLGVNMVVNFFAATVFAALMCVFWWFVASQEMTHAVRRKANLLFVTREAIDQEPLLRDAGLLLDARMHALERGIQDRNVRAKEAYRVAQNRRLMLMWMAPLLAVYAGLLLATIVYNHTRTHCANDPRALTFGHWGGMILVFFSYIPEILFFLFVIEWMVPIGDYDIMQRVLGLRPSPPP